MPKRNQIVLFIILAFLAASVAVIPDIVSDDLKAWCLLHLGPDYSKYLIGLFLVGFLILFYLSSDLRKNLFSANGKGTIEPAKTPWSPANQQFLQSAEENIAAAAPEATIKALLQLKNTAVDAQLSLISTRLAQFRKDEIAGVLTHEQNTTQLNRINKDLLFLIKDVENQLTAGQKENQTLRDAFRQRYRDRLVQKLASRQPVNLRRLTSTEGTSERVADTFIPYNSEEIKEEIGKTFQAAHGRLLIVGQPGAGKTTLLLQLADCLFDLEDDALPIVINLATWESGYKKLEPWMKPYIDLSKWQKREGVYKKLESWLEVILAAELNINKAGVQAVLYQSKLILLLDGLDEIMWDEAINSCLAAIADYGAASGRRFVITCRIEEYKRAAEDARVNMQIEIGPLTSEQLEAELTRMGREQPEAIPLLQAIQKDPLLRQAVEIPFYFNTLQLLFAGRLPVFTTTDLDNRKQEIKQLFIQSALQCTAHKNYPAADSTHWLSFLAANMNDRNLVVFELRDLQYDWWRGWSRWDKLVACFIFGLIFWAGVSLIILLIILLIFGLMYELIGVLTLLPILIVLIGGPMPRIETRDTMNWSVKAFVKKVKDSLIDYLIFALFSGLIFALIFGLSHELTAVLIFMQPVMLTFWLIGSLDTMIETESSDFIQIKSPYQRFYASMKIFYFSILQHWHLRYLLYKKGALPLDLVHFLNEMKDRNLLESDGATWRFRHRMIQDYFAELWKWENMPLALGKEKSTSK